MYNTQYLSSEVSPTLTYNLSTALSNPTPDPFLLIYLMNNRQEKDTVLIKYQIYQRRDS